MSRVVTASEVDRLHQQVAELTQRVSALEQTPNLTPAASPSELFEELPVQEPGEVIDVLASELPSAI